jgi:type II secretion system protein N
MMNLIVLFFRFLKNNIARISLVLLLSIVFLFILFPLGDLNDLVSSEVSKATQNRVYMQFENMSLNPLTLTVGLEKLSIETPSTNTIAADELKVSPSLTAAVTKQIGGTLNASGFLKGDVSIEISPASGGEGPKKSKVDIVASDISLNDARQVARLSLPLKGQLNLTSQAVIDLNPFIAPNPEDNSTYEQPDMDVNLTITKFELPSTTVNTGMMGSLNVPEVKFDKVELKGKLSNGKFQIESGKLGSNKNDLYGDIRGELGLSLVKSNGRIIPQFGSYNISVDLKANTAFQQKAGLFLSFLESSKTSSGATAQYKFRVQGDMMGGAFNMTPIR